MLNEQLPCMTPFSHIDQPGLSWCTRGRRENGVMIQSAAGSESLWLGEETAIGS